MANKVSEVKKQTNTLVSSLYSWNIIVAGLSLAEAGVIIWFAHSYIYSIVVNYLTKDTLKSTLTNQTVYTLTSHHLFDVNLSYLIVLFLLISAAIHVLLATYRRPDVEALIDKKQNTYKWLEQSLVLSLILISVGLILGLADLASLTMIVVFSFSFNILGSRVEKNSSKTKVGRSVLLAIVLVGLAPLVVLGFYLLGGSVYGLNLSRYSLFEFLILIVFYLCFSLNFGLQHKKIGRWKQYLYGEKVNIALLFLTESVLVWLIYASLLRT